MFSRLANARQGARRYLGAAVVDGFFNGFSRIARLHPQSKPARHAVEHLRDIRYHDSGEDQLRPLAMGGGGDLVGVQLPFEVQGGAAHGGGKSG